MMYAVQKSAARDCDWKKGAEAVCWCSWHKQELTIKLALELNCIVEIYLAAGQKLVCSEAGGAG